MLLIRVSSKESLSDKVVERLKKLGNIIKYQPHHVLVQKMDGWCQDNVFVEIHGIDEGLDRGGSHNLYQAIGVFLCGEFKKETLVASSELGELNLVAHYLSFTGG